MNGEIIYFGGYISWHNCHKKHYGDALKEKKKKRNMSYHMVKKPAPGYASKGNQIIASKTPELPCSL